MTFNKFAAAHLKYLHGRSPKERHELSLGGLENLSVPEARALAAATFGVLKLNGIKTLSGAAAAELANYEGGLYLNGITELSGEAASARSKHARDT